MNLQSLTLFKMSERKMGWLAQNQRVLSQNIANADTPKYEPRELQEISFARELRDARVKIAVTNERHINENTPPLRMERTHMSHMQPQHGPEAFRTFTQRRSYENSLDRNSVILEEQGLKMSETRDMHDRVATIYQKYTNMIKSSLGNQG